MKWNAFSFSFLFFTQFLFVSEKNTVELIFFSFLILFSAEKKMAASSFQCQLVASTDQFGVYEASAEKYAPPGANTTIRCHFSTLKEPVNIYLCQFLGNRTGHIRYVIV